MTIPLVSPLLARSSDLPGDSDGPSGPALRLGASLFGLAPCGVLPATRVTTGAVRSYRTFSPLPSGGVRSRFSRGHLPETRKSRSDPTARRYVFCATVLQVALTGDYPAHCPAEFGLSSLRLGSTSLAERRSSGSLRSTYCTTRQSPG